jgi:hypothetical protein
VRKTSSMSTPTWARPAKTSRAASSTAPDDRADGAGAGWTSPPWSAIVDDATRTRRALLERQPVAESCQGDE